MGTREQARELKEGMDTPSLLSTLTYTMSYSDRGRICSGSVTLTFEDQGNGYDVSGFIKDDDGKSDITEGFAAYDGTAYWKDTCVEGDVGLSVLSKGKFNYKTGVFTGTWESSTGVSGVYNTFHPVAINVTPEAVEQALPETFGQGVPEAEIVVDATTVPNDTDNTKVPVPTVGKWTRNKSI